MIGLRSAATITPLHGHRLRPLSRAETPRGNERAERDPAHRRRDRHREVRDRLQRAITAEQPGHPGGVQAIAAAFGHTFWVAVALIAATLIPALLLPRPAATVPGRPAMESGPAH